MSRGVAVVVGVVLIAAGIVALISWMTSTEETRTETFEGVSDLVFDLDNGPIEIVAGGDVVVVDVSLMTGLFRGEATVETVTLRHECPFFGWSCGASFEVTAPVGTEVRGSTSNGAVTVVGIEGPLTASTSNGAITLDSVSSIADVGTSNGSITGTNLGSDVLEARTSNGRVDLSFAVAPSSLDISTSNGTVDVLLPSESPPYAVTSSTSNGEVTTDIRTDPASSQTIVIDTSNGDINVTYNH